MRFTGVTVPRGATVTNAYVQFQVDEATTAATSLTVAGEAADNPPGFTTASKNISARPRTTAAVAWVPAAWPTRCAQGGPADAEPCRGPRQLQQGRLLGRPDPAGDDVQRHASTVRRLPLV